MNTHSCIKEKVNTCNIKKLTLVLVELFIIKYRNARIRTGISERVTLLQLQSDLYFTN